MTESEDPGLLAIEVDADDYAETAAGDTPAVPRTYQSEADFQAIRATYSAKTGGDTEAGGGTYAELIAVVPVLGDGADGEGIERMGGEVGKVKLGKKEMQLLGYAVGEMCFDRRYGEVVELCERVWARCEVDAKTEETLERWARSCRERLSRE